jgi:hypothetical protein
MGAFSGEFDALQVMFIPHAVGLKPWNHCARLAQPKMLYRFFYRWMNVGIKANTLQRHFRPQVREHDVRVMSLLAVGMGFSYMSISA